MANTSNAYPAAPFDLPESSKPLGKYFARPIQAGDRALLQVFNEDVHSSIPEDTVEITADEHLALIIGIQAGKQVKMVDGKLTLVDYAMPDDVLAGCVRAQRNDLLVKCDGTISRHRDQVDEGIDTTITDEQYKGWLKYRRLLRDLPQQPGFPKNVVWPDEPK